MLIVLDTYKARSRRSFIKSSSSSNIRLFESSRSGSNLLRTPGNSTSAGIIHYVPYTRANGVSLVARHGVVRCDHRTPSSSSAHLPFLVSSRFLSPSRMVLLMVSAWSLHCGYLGIDLVSRIFHFSQKASNLVEINWDPLSVTISYGTPCLQTIFHHTKLSTWVSLMLA